MPVQIDSRLHCKMCQNCAIPVHSLIAVLIHKSGHFGPPLPFWAAAPQALPGLPMAIYATAYPHFYFHLPSIFPSRPDHSFHEVSTWDEYDVLQVLQCFSDA